MHGFGIPNACHSACLFAALRRSRERLEHWCGAGRQHHQHGVSGSITPNSGRWWPSRGYDPAIR